MKTKFNPSRLLTLIRREESHDPKNAVEITEIDEELSEEEIAACQAILDEQMRESAETILEEMENKDSWKIPQPVKRFLSISMLLLASVLGLFIVNQVVIFANEVSSMPALWKWPAIICVSFFSGIIVFIIATLFWKMIRLQRNRQVNPAALKALSERRHLQLISAEKEKTARTLLLKYLDHYPLDNKNKRRLLKLGMREDEWLSLTTTRDALKSGADTQSVEEWLIDFTNGFQRTLDRFARRRIRQYSIKVGSGTALSPIAIVDQMIVLYGCTALIREMLLIYNLRPAWGQCGVILSRSIILTYLSGVIEGATESAVDAGADSISDFMGSSFNFLTGTIGRAVGAKTAEATLNGILIWRLGKGIIAQLQPVRG